MIWEKKWLKTKQKEDIKSQTQKAVYNESRVDVKINKKHQGTS